LEEKMAMIPLKKPWHTIAMALAGIGALSLGAVKFLNINILSAVPTGMVSTVAIGAIGLSGVYVLALLFKKKI
jgi:uncharacterized membrane protein YuzA (DUF378 family)